tara:strand:- start:718 stop:996 length:279 start_codon:yes stop_codon:yes gene_type:complete
MAHFAIYRDKMDANAQWVYTKDDGTEVCVEGVYGTTKYIYSTNGATGEWTDAVVANKLAPSDLLTALASEVGESVTFDTALCRNENPVTEAE